MHCTFVTTEVMRDCAKSNPENFKRKLRNWWEVIIEGNKSRKDQIEQMKSMKPQIEQMESIWIILQYFKIQGIIEQFWKVWLETKFL